MYIGRPAIPTKMIWIVSARFAKLHKNNINYAIQTIEPASHWPELRAVIVVVSNSEKKVGSSEAMRNTIKTSELFKARVSEIVPKRVERFE